MQKNVLQKELITIVRRHLRPLQGHLSWLNWIQAHQVQLLHLHLIRIELNIGKSPEIITSAINYHWLIVIIVIIKSLNDHVIKIIDKLIKCVITDMDNKGNFHQKFNLIIISANKWIKYANINKIVCFSSTCHQIFNYVTMRVN